MTGLVAALRRRDCCRLTISAGIRRFGRDERGVTAVIFGIMFACVLLAAGMAVDYTRAITEKSREQSALDAGVLAASKYLGLADQDTTGPQIVRNFFAANMRSGSPATVASVNFDSTAGTIDAAASSTLSTTLMKVFGHTSMSVGAASQVVRGDGTVEISLVLDNSGSMAGTYIADLKTAAKNLVGVAMAGAEGTGKVTVGLVPFSAAVNVGSGYANASWIDQTSASPIHSENFDVTKSRFDLFSDLSVTWGGCVESRPGAFDTSDAVPDAANGQTLFVPMFAPDEPDDSNASAAGYGSYANDYISDFGGTCPPPDQVCVTFSKKKNTCTKYGPAPIDVATAQSRTCKYAGAIMTGGTGPNYMCSSQPILPLNSNKATIEAAIDAMSAGGNTNIGEGTMWGWRVLSPTLPFTEGRAYTDTKNKKVMIVMTDGQNTYSYAANHNESRYGASGYAAKGRLGNTYSSTAYVSAMNTKLLTACANAKAAGISVYTVAFRLETDPDTTSLLTQCATSDDKFFAASNGSTLIQAFQSIGTEIAELRVSN